MNITKFLKSIVGSGTSFVDLPSEKRNIWITNLVSLVLSVFILIVFVYRTFLGGPFKIFNVMLIYWAISIIPIILNRFKLLNASRILICWFAPAMILSNAIILLSNSFEVETSTYLGLRIFLIPFSTIPFLVFKSSEKGYMALGLTVPLICLFLFDPILNYIGIGYLQMGLHDSSYSYNNFRMIVSFLILGLSFYFLKQKLEQGERINEQLLIELEKKNEMILRQAASEVTELNKKLLSSLQELREREFILNESQKIAKMGSWRYKLEDKSLLWSDEMSTILGVAKSFEPTLKSIAQLFETQIDSTLLSAFNHLLSSGEMLDISFQIKTPSGREKWLRINGFPLYGQEGISGATGICHDITFFKEAEERIASNEKKYKSLFEQASDAIMITDLKGDFMDVNTSMCKMLGYPKEELL